MGLLNSIFGCSSKKQTDERLDPREFATEKTQITEAYEVKEYDSQIRDHISKKVDEAKSLIQKYCENKAVSQINYNVQTIDMVFENGTMLTGNLKKDPFVVEALEAVFGKIWWTITTLHDKF